MTSHPVVQQAENSLFKAQLRPDKEGHKNSFLTFQLTVINKTSEPLLIDWNKTTYLHNGQSHGGFLFEGIKPGYVKGATELTDTIPGESVYRKVIAPTHLVAYTPIKDQQKLKPDEKPISAGPLPVGENGIKLVVGFRNIEVEEVITVDLRETPVP